MGWFRSDDGRHENPKLIRAGLEADGLAIRMGTYSSRHETDGFVDEVIVEGLARVRHWRKIVTVLEVEQLIHRDDDRRGWWVHDYLDYNPSHSDLEDKRAKERARKTRQPRAESGRFQPDSGPVPRGSGEESATVHTVPIPSHPIPVSSEEETKTRRTGASPLPSDFALTSDMRHWATEHAPNVDVTHETKRFHEWAISRNKRYADWLATWRNWMLRVQGEITSRPAARQPLGDRSTDRILRVVGEATGAAAPELEIS